MDKQPRFRDFVITVLKRSFASWHGDGGWMALAAYAAIILLPFLLTGVFSDATNQGISDRVERLIAYVAAGWLFILVVAITPFRIWRDQIKKIDELATTLDTKEQRIAALKELGRVWENATQFVNDIVKLHIRSKALSVNTALALVRHEEKIYEKVEAISPGEVSTFRTVGSFNMTDHPAEYQPSEWDDDKRLVIFSERLLRVRKFIDKHSPPSGGT